MSFVYEYYEACNVISHLPDGRVLDVVEILDRCSRHLTQDRMMDLIAVVLSYYSRHEDGVDRAVFVLSNIKITYYQELCNYILQDDHLTDDVEFSIGVLISTYPVNTGLLLRKAKKYENKYVEGLLKAYDRSKYH